MLRDYPSEDMAIMDYMRALLAFRKHGESARSRKALEKAYEKNRYVPLFLIGLWEMSELPEYYSPGGEDEAIIITTTCMEAWHETPGAMEWFAMEICAMALVKSAEMDMD